MSAFIKAARATCRANCWSIVSEGREKGGCAPLVGGREGR